VPHPTLGDDVAAAVVLRPGATLDRKTLTDSLRDKLGDTKVPRRILFVDDIPKGRTGKIQRYKLAAAFGLDRRDTAREPGRHVAARTPLEATLQRVWADTLQRPTVPLDEDFFALGGDSLLAVELFLRIEETLGRRLPRGALFEANTVADMATYIETSSPTRCLVPIRPEGTRPILYCMHDMFGQVLNFRGLARHLGSDQPVYGLQLAGLDGSEPPLARVEDMAKRYLTEIRTVQPAGPYHLCGYSMGGLIAYEMAQRLHAAGETVGLLALLDTFPRYGRRRPALPYWFGQQGNRLQTLGPASVGRYAGRGLRNIANNVCTAVWRHLFGIAWRFCERFMAAPPKCLYRPVAANLLATRSYRMRAYAGDAVLFNAASFRRDHDHMVESWRALIGGRLDVVPIAGLHNEILDEPHVQELARALSDRLRERHMRKDDPRNSAAAD